MLQKTGFQSSQRESSHHKYPFLKEDELKSRRALCKKDCRSLLSFQHMNHIHGKMTEEDRISVVHVLQSLTYEHVISFIIQIYVKTSSQLFLKQFVEVNVNLSVIHVSDHTSLILLLIIHCRESSANTRISLSRRESGL